MKFLTIVISLLGALAFGGCAFFDKITDEDKAVHKEAVLSFEAIGKPQIDQKKYAARIALGQKLYFENKLSINNKISCNSCHQLDNFGVDNQPTSPGHDGTRGERNSPTVYNAVYNLAQFWDGRAKDLAVQAEGPILNPIEHGLPNAQTAMKKINTKEYKEMFAKAFPTHKWPFTYKNLGRAIGDFEKTLITPSRFDDYLNGHLKALSKNERRGLKKFIKIGCVDCHNGQGIGGGLYQKIGVEHPYPTKDKGRFEVTKDEDDMFVFKVPILRNIEHTGPYFHDGSVKTLEEAVRLMGWHQLGKKLSKEDISDLVTFLESLEGKKGTFFKQ